MKVLGCIVIALGIICGLYVGGWLMFIPAIIEACQCFDAGTLTGTIFDITTLKCIFASLVGCIISILGAYVGYIILYFTY